MRTGIDIVEVKRIKLTDEFLSKIANEQEIEYLNTYQNEELRRQSCAGLWAVKEAIFKMLELGRYSGVSFKNVELYHNEQGKPYVKLNGVALEKFQQLKLNEIEVSISHTSDYAVANAVARG